MSHTRAVWLFILSLTAIRFTMLGTSDLSFDEAHYWMWSERLAPAYFSKGPGIALPFAPAPRFLARPNLAFGSGVRFSAARRACSSIILLGDCSTSAPLFG